MNAARSVVHKSLLGPCQNRGSSWSAAAIAYPSRRINACRHDRIRCASTTIAASQETFQAPAPSMVRVFIVSE
jgi:hypothetical protein